MEATRKLLVVEDDPDVQELLQYNLEKCGWQVSVANSGETALLAVVDLQPDFILLDVMLPGLDGLQVCRQVRSYPKTSSIPIIMLSAVAQEKAVVEGLQVGADDYVIKPFSPKVLQARIQAVLRRSSVRHVEVVDPPIQIHNLHIDPLRHTVKVSGKLVELSRTDLLVLKLLAGEPGRVFTRRQIIDAGHGRAHAISDRSVDVQIVGLRRKIGSAGRFIETVRGVGYRIQEE